MKVKELRDKLNNLPEYLDISVCDLEGACIGIVGVDMVYPVVYLNVAQIFPDDWYKGNGEEIKLQTL